METKMTQLVKTWDTATLQSTQKDYLNAQTHYTGFEREEWQFQILKTKTEIITKELEKRAAGPIDAGNKTTYSWEQFNNALMNTGQNPRQILRILSALKKEQ